MKKINVFETFSGIGSQHKALENLTNNKIIEGYDVVGISEWYISAIIAYTLIHYNEQFHKELQDLENKYLNKDKELKSVILKDLEDFVFSTNSKDPCNLQRTNLETLKKLYVSMKISKNLGSVVALQPEEMPKEIDVLTYSFPCFIEGTLILTENGYKKIEDITNNDYVLTHTNKYQKVVKPMINQADHIYQLSSMASEDLFVTEEHPFYVRKMKKEWNKNTRRYKRIFEEPKWVETKNLTKKDYLGIAINQKSELPNWNGVTDKRHTKNSENKNELKELFKNKDFWWFVGLYLGDGWNQIDESKNKYRTIVCASKKNNQHLKIEKKLNNLNLNYSKVEETTVYKYHITIKELTLFLEQFGKYAYGKEINNTILDLPIKYLKKFIQGFIFADGSYIKKTGKFSITSVSTKLIYGLGQAIAKAYNTPYGIYKYKNNDFTTIQGRTVSQKDTYILRFKLKRKKQDKAFYENGYIWFPLSKLERQEYNGKVYNFEVENDNSYTVNNIIVHNCQDLSNAGLKKGLEVGTRSGLLWEIGRILKGMDENDRPNVLLMENVPTLFNRFKDGWDVWKEELDKLGYDTYQTKLTASNFNVPQMRIRAFAISVKRNGNVNEDFLKDFDLDEKILESDTFQNARNEINKNGRKNIIDILDKNVPSKYYITKPFNVLKSTDGKTGAKFDLIDHSTYEIANRVYFTDHMSPTLTTSGIIKIYESEKETIRQIKEVEAFRLMGFTTEDYNKVDKHFTKGHLYKFAGNSIVVNVLEGLFEVIYKIIKK